MIAVSQKTMTAGVLTGPARLAFEQWSVPTPGPGEVLVRVTLCSVCPTDLRKYSGASEVDYPIILGHEAVGTVADCGPDVGDWPDKTDVIVNPCVYCGSCHYCLRGRQNLCTNLRSIGGAGERGTKLHGAFAQYVIVPQACLHRLPPGLDAAAATFADPLASALNSVLNVSQVGMGDDFVVVGGGPLGLLHLLLGRARGARVTVVEPDGARRQVASSLGANFVTTPQDAENFVAQITDGRGADAVTVCVGRPDAHQAALRMCGRGGRINIFAGTYPAPNFLVNANDLHYGQRILTGAFAHTPDLFERSVRVLAERIIDVAPLISRTYGLSQLGEGFADTAAGRGLKKMVDPWL